MLEEMEYVWVITRRVFNNVEKDEYEVVGSSPLDEKVLRNDGTLRSVVWPEWLNEEEMDNACIKWMGFTPTRNAWGESKGAIPEVRVEIYRVCTRNERVTRVSSLIDNSCFTTDGPVWDD